ncbi:MAG: hypothetical protein V7784_18440 [Oceanospirillaceae bacterium]
MNDAFHEHIGISKLKCLEEPCAHDLFRTKAIVTAVLIKHSLDCGLLKTNVSLNVTL